MSCDFFYVGITHQTAPLGVRERVRPDAERQRAILSGLSRIAGGRMVLSTCERFEAYAHRTPVSAREWGRQFGEWFDLPAALLSTGLQIERGGAAAEHLLRVAAGLESRILGEAPILGQVRASFAQAAEAQALDPELSALARAAIRAGKRVRHETALADGARSIATLAVDRVAAQLGSVRHLHVTVLGSGQLSSEVLADLARRRAGKVTVVGRNPARTAELAARFEAACGGFSSVTAVLTKTDAVITCTSAPGFLVDASTLGGIRDRPLCLVDLCVPRNIDPAVAGLAKVHLISLDEISCGRTTRLDALAAARRIVQEELAALLEWVDQRRAVPQIARLVRDVQARRQCGLHVDGRALHERIVRLKLGAAA